MKVAPENGVLSMGQFQTVAEIAFREAGLAISPSKNAMVFSRLVKRMRVLGLQDVDGYIQDLKHSTDPVELGNLVSALTTNVTQFFREPHHFDLLRSHMTDRWSKRARQGHVLRFWSAGCSTGMEPYSIAMTIADVLPDFQKWDIRILATDIDHEMIEQARQGIYPQASVRHIPLPMRQTMLERRKNRSMDPTALGCQPSVTVRPEIRGLVTFNTHNLIGAWPMRHKFDAIFCRNVVIYFDETTQALLWPKFAAATAESGLLFLGHSERLIECESLGYRSIGLSAFQMEASSDFPIFQKEISHGAS